MASVTVQGGGSGTGLTQVAAGAFQIGNSDVDAFSKLATPDATALVDHQVLKQGFIMVTNKDVTGRHEPDHRSGQADLDRQRSPTGRTSVAPTRRSF